MSDEDTAAASFDLEGFLPYRFNRLADRISGELEQMYAARYRLNVAQWRILAWLSHCGELSASRICETTRMDKARVSRAVQALEARGLISRRPSSRDQRLQELRLTEAGEALLGELIPEARAWEAELVAPLTAGERRDLCRIMGKLERQLARGD